MLGETITRHRRGDVTGADAQGNPTYGPDVEASIPIKAFAPSGADEAGNRSDASGTIYGFRGTDLVPADRVTIRGQMWHVEGLKQDWAGYSRNAPDGCVVSVRRAT